MTLCACVWRERVCRNLSLTFEIAQQSQLLHLTLAIQRTLTRQESLSFVFFCVTIVWCSYVMMMSFVFFCRLNMRYFSFYLDMFLSGAGIMDLIPRSCHFPPDVTHVTQVLNMDHLRKADMRPGLLSSDCGE